MSLVSHPCFPSGSGTKGSAPGEDRLGQQGRSRDVGGTCLMVTVLDCRAGKGCGDRRGVLVCALARPSREKRPSLGGRKEAASWLLDFNL